MTDFDPRDQENSGNIPVDPLQPTAPDPSPVHEPAGEAAVIPEAPQPPLPHLTLDPDPEPPVIPEPPVPTPEPPKASPFQAPNMPEPPRAPEPPRPGPAYWQTPQQTRQPQPLQQTQQPQQNPGPNWGTPPPQTPPYQPAPYPRKNNYQPVYNVPPAGYAQKSRLAAGLLGLFLGALGIHNFYLGFNTKATIQLVVTLVGGLITCGLASVAMSIWGFVEGILLISANPSHLYDGNGVILRD